MSFDTEPYGLFVDDLLTGLTGGTVRETFVFGPGNEPYRLSAGPFVLAATVRVHGLTDGVFTRFRRDTDFSTGPDATIGWAATTPPQTGLLPDPGSRFYASYETVPDPQVPPPLTDRNPGSIVRILAESFAREYAVMSIQLGAVYRAGFLATAEGRDLDQLVALVGLQRRTGAVAGGEVVFARSSPAQADVFIPAGTVVSSGVAAGVAVETTDDGVLRAGGLSVAVGVRSLTAGPGGVAPAGTLCVVTRPILGVETVTNPQALTVGGADESDVTLRRRAKYALETTGAATVDSIIGALTAVEGIRGQDVRITEDHVSAPGILQVSVAADLSPTQAQFALTQIERHRPAGIRVLHDLPVPPDAPLPVPAPIEDDPTPEPAGLGNSGPHWFDIAVRASITPVDTNLPTARQRKLVADLGAALHAVIDDASIGDTVVHARLVAAVMAVPEVSDVVLELFPAVTGSATGNVALPANRRPRLLDDPNLTVLLRGALVAVDVAVAVDLLGLSTTVAPAIAVEEARRSIGQRLADASRSMARIDTPSLFGALATDTGTYHVRADGFTFVVEFVQEGQTVQRQDVSVPIGADQLLWIRAVTVTVASSVVPSDETVVPV